jgi:hypothetical protein
MQRELVDLCGLRRKLVRNQQYSTHIKQICSVFRRIMYVSDEVGRGLILLIPMRRLTPLFPALTDFD